jgi:[acyl-carrier-protein] S-malonyltransferase
MNRVFVFPGQGSQYIGMGKDIYDNFKIAREVFEEVDSALNQNLSKIIFDGESDLLTMTVNAQPALMATSIAILRVILELRGAEIETLCRFVCGHSLGEYTALCATGCLSLSDTAKLLRIRGLAMQTASSTSSGGMIACIGMDLTALEAMISDAQKFGICQIANDNSLEQVIVSGNTTAIDYIAAVMKDLGKKAIKLKVSGAFHSALMLPAVDKMQQALSEINLLQPSVPLVANVLATSVSDPGIIKKCLLKQVTGRVRWRETMDFLVTQEIEEVVEIGPGKVLSTLASRHSHGFTTTNIGTLSEVLAFSG